MADEIRITTSLQIDNGEFQLPRIGGSSVNVDQSAAGGMVPGVVTIGNGAEEDVDTSELTTLGWCWMKNLDPSNYVKYGPKSGAAMVEFGRLMPGEPAHLFRLAPGITLRMIADTAACKVQILANEN